MDARQVRYGYTKRPNSIIPLLNCEEDTVPSPR